MTTILDKLRLSFTDKTAETVFRHEYVHAVWSYYRYGSLAVAAVHATTLGYFYVMAGTLLGVTILQFVLSLAFFAVTFHRTPAVSKMVPWLAASLAVMSTLIAKVEFLSNNFDVYQQIIDRDILIDILALYIMLRLRTPQSFLVAALYTLSVGFICFVWREVAFQNLPHLIFVVGIAHLFGICVAYGLERNSRRGFLDRQMLVIERGKSERLLASMLPESIAETLKERDGTIAQRADEVTVLFADIVGFTPLAAKMPPEELVELLNAVFSRFDAIVGGLGAEKIKTIGDAYMAVAGAPTATKYHADIMADVAIAMMADMRSFNAKNRTNMTLRIGMASGPVVAGVIGTRRFSYDMWGEAVNLASRMESSGTPDLIQIAASTLDRLSGHYATECRGEIEVKGVGKITTHWLVGRVVGKVAS